MRHGPGNPISLSPSLQVLHPPSMSSIVLPSRGQCIQITDNVQHCQCLCFFPPASPLLDQNICGLCGHSIHTHVDYVSMVVHHCFATNCAAYVQKTPRTQGCTCSASLIDHEPVVNMYRSPATPPYGVDVHNDLSSSINTFNDNTTRTSFTPTSPHALSTNDNPSYSYGNSAIFTPTSQPVTQTSIAQYQDDNSSAHIQDSSARFREDYMITTYNAAHYGAETWAD